MHMWRTCDLEWYAWWLDDARAKVNAITENSFELPTLRSESFSAQIIIYCSIHCLDMRTRQGCNSLLSRETKSMRIKIYLQDQNLKPSGACGGLEWNLLCFSSLLPPLSPYFPLQAFLHFNLAGSRCVVGTILPHNSNELHPWYAGNLLFPIRNSNVK